MTAERNEEAITELERAGTTFDEPDDSLEAARDDLVVDAETPNTRESAQANVVRTTVHDGLEDCFEESGLLATAATNRSLPRMRTVPRARPTARL